MPDPLPDTFTLSGFSLQLVGGPGVGFSSSVSRFVGVLRVRDAGTSSQCKTTTLSSSPGQTRWVCAGASGSQSDRDWLPPCTSLRRQQAGPGAPPEPHSLSEPLSYRPWIPPGNDLTFCVSLGAHKAVGFIEAAPHCCLLRPESLSPQPGPGASGSWPRLHGCGGHRADGRRSSGRARIWGK